MLIKILASNAITFGKSGKSRATQARMPQKEVTEHSQIGVPSHLWKVEPSIDTSNSEQSPAPGARQGLLFLAYLKRKQQLRWH